MKPCPKCGHLHRKEKNGCERYSDLVFSYVLLICGREPEKAEELHKKIMAEKGATIKNVRP